LIIEFLVLIELQAVIFGFDDIFEVLVKANGNIHEIDNDGDTLLSWG
jgi:hypothetical protein